MACIFCSQRTSVGLTLVKSEPAALLVLALMFAAMKPECGLAPLEHGPLRGLAFVGLGHRRSAAMPVLLRVEFVGLIAGISSGWCLCGC